MRGNGSVLVRFAAVLPREVVNARARAEGRDAGEGVLLESLRGAGGAA